MAAQYESWLPWLRRQGISTLKIGAQVLINSFFPGYGSIVDFGEALYEFQKGNIMGGVSNVGFGLVNFATFGLSNSLKEGAKSSFEKLAKSFGPEFVPIVERYGKFIFEKVLGESGKMTLKKAWDNLFMNIISSCGQPDAVSEAVIQSGFEWIVPAMFKVTKNNKMLSLTMMAMLEKLAKEEVKKYERQLLDLNYRSAFMKAIIKKMTNSESDSDQQA